MHPYSSLKRKHCLPRSQQQQEDAEVLTAVDAGRKRFGLAPLRDTDFPDLLTQQKEETVEALSKVSV